MLEVPQVAERLSASHEEPYDSLVYMIMSCFVTYYKPEGGGFHSRCHWTLDLPNPPSRIMAL
jgi:hypothetical protein